MHLILTGVVGILSLLSILFTGLWFIRTGIFPGFGIYSFITIGLVALSTGFFMTQVGGPVMGLAERIPAFFGFLWTFILGLWMSGRSGTANQ